MDDQTAYEQLKPHLKPYNPTIPLGPRDGLFIEQEDGPPLLYIGGIKHAYTID
ncbi:hypothetical protein [Streptomyces sp. WAC08241]|uniref:hypothetical protein n=1 Tax=Streptomyces sp. WAC08241 TaxID=2487421 RepID=UPI00163CA208|nr:hypothetical protein [Streptomyces sp. WAC08241]